MRQNDASAGLQLRSISALEVQGSDGVVTDLLDGNAAEDFKVRLFNNGEEELSCVCIQPIGENVKDLGKGYNSISHAYLCKFDQQLRTHLNGLVHF